MQKISLILLSLSCLIGSILFNSCSDEIEPINTERGDAYFPIEKGQWISYQLDTTIYNDFDQSVKTVSYEIKEVIGESIEDLAGRPTNKVYRYVKDSLNGSWNSLNVWKISLTESMAEKVEENLPFIKLAFPLRVGKTWAGNTKINTELDTQAFYDGWQYEVAAIDSSTTVNGLTFNETAHIVQNDYENLIRRIYSEEVYAKNIGLIFKRQWNLELKTSNTAELDGVPWPTRANSGQIVEWRVLDYGKE